MAHAVRLTHEGLLEVGHCGEVSDIGLLFGVGSGQSDVNLCHGLELVLDLDSKDNGTNLLVVGPVADI